MSPKNTIVLYTATLCFALALGVLLSATHAKEVAAITLPTLLSTAKNSTDESHMLTVGKIIPELHDHTHKQVKIFGNSSPDHPIQADGRSLRLLNDTKKDALHNRMGDKIRLWLFSHSLYLA